MTVVIFPRACSHRFNRHPGYPCPLLNLLMYGLVLLMGMSCGSVRNGLTLKTTGSDWVSDSASAADMSQFTPGASPIQGQPWVIGTGVAGYVWQAPNPRAVLLLQHGYSEYAQRFVRQYNALIPHLLKAGISVYAFDMWGHGHSPGKRALTNVNQAVKDHLAARSKLQQQSLPLFVMGHSLGGLVTASSIVKRPSGVAGMILTGPALLYAQDKPINRIILNVGAFIAPGLKIIPASGFETLFHGAKNSSLLARDTLLYKGSMRIVVAATALSLTHKNWKRYAGITTPTLAMHGTDDKSTDPKGSRRLINTISSSDKTLYLVEGGYHELLNDTRKDETLQVLLAWLESHLRQ